MTALGKKEKLEAALLTTHEVLALAERAEREAKLSGLMAAAAITAFVISPPLTLGFSIAASLGIGASLENFARAKEWTDIVKKRERWEVLDDAVLNDAPPALSAKTLSDRKSPSPNNPAPNNTTNQPASSFS